MRVMVADDSMLFREGLVRVLREAGHVVVATAADAVGARLAVAEHGPDIAILDIRMPPDLDADGARAALDLRSRHPETAILLLSQHVELRHCLPLIGSPGFGYLLKDRVVRLDEFDEMLRRVALGGTALDPQIAASLVQARRSALAVLTDRECEVLALVAEGHANAVVARRLRVSERTVEAHMRAVFIKLDLPDDGATHRRVLAVVTLPEVAGRRRVLRAPGRPCPRPVPHVDTRLPTVRIVHISDCYSPRVGGIESQVQDLASNQAARGDAVHVLTATALPRGAEKEGRNRYRASVTEAPRLRVHRLASWTTFGIPVHPRGLWLIRRALTMLRPDVVHVHAGVVSPFAYDGARAARSLELPLAITWHCMLDGVEGLVAAGARATGWDDARFAASAVSSVAAERVSDALDREDVSVLPNGLDLEPWRRAAVDPVPNPPTLRVVATQRLAPRKRAMPLIRTIERAHRELGSNPDGTPRIRLTLIGGGPAEGQVRAQVLADGLGDVVQVLGRVPREDLPAHYREHDVFVAPAVLEAFGIAPLEARVAGLAVVGRAGTGVSEFVTDGVNGFLAPTDEGMTDALVRLAREPDLLATIRAANAAEPPAVAWPDVLGVADTLYQRAIANRPI